MGLNYNPASVTQGLVYYLDLTNSRCYSGSGNTLTNLANGAIGITIVSGITYDTDYRKNLNFNGSSGYMTGNDTNLNFSTSDFTIQTTLKLNGLSNGFNGAYGSIICAGSALTNNSSIFYVSGTATSHYAVAIYHEPTLAINGRNFNFQTNKIYNLAVTKRYNVVEFFVDGSSIGTTTTSNNYNFTANGFTMGRWFASGVEQYLKGSIFDFRAYNRALSQEELQQNYFSQTKRYYNEENIVTNGLVLNIDPSKSTSYAGSGNTIYDLSGSAINGALINTPSFSGLNGGQISMPGSSKYIDLGQNFNFTSQNFSISYWVYLDSFTTNQAGQGPIPFFKGDYQQMGYYSQIDSNGSFGFATNQGGAIQTSSTLAGVITTSTWYHLSYVRNGTSVRLYSNGVDRTSAVASHNNPGSSNQTFKINYYKPDYLITSQMRISQFLIYNRALTQQEISQNFNATRSRFGI